MNNRTVIDQWTAICQGGSVAIGTWAEHKAPVSISYFDGNKKIIVKDTEKGKILLKRPIKK